MATAQMMDVKGMKAVLLDLNVIKAVPAMQPRVEMDMEYCMNMTVAFEEGDDPPPPVHVFWDGKTYWLVDGFHRFKALKALEYKGRKYQQIRAYIHNGTKKDAIVFAAQVNLGPRSKPMSNADRKKAMWMLMDFPDLRGKSPAFLGDKFGLTGTTAKKYWMEYFATRGLPIPAVAERADGILSPVNRGNYRQTKSTIPIVSARDKSDVRQGDPSRAVPHGAASTMNGRLVGAAMEINRRITYYDNFESIGRELLGSGIVSDKAYPTKCSLNVGLYARSVSGIAVTWESFRDKSAAPAAFGRAMHARDAIGASRAVILCPVEDGPKDVMDNYTRAYGVEWLTIEGFIESLKGDAIQ